MTVYEICAIIVTAGFVVLVIYLIQTLIHLKRTTRSMNNLIESVSGRLAEFDRTFNDFRDISQNLKSLISQFGGPATKISAVLAAVMQGITLWWEAKHRRDRSGRKKDNA